MNLRRIAALAVLMCSILSVPSRADVVSDWNSIRRSVLDTRASRAFVDSGFRDGACRDA
jgi:hypothetical protein